MAKGESKQSTEYDKLLDEIQYMDLPGGYVIYEKGGAMNDRKRNRIENLARLI